MSKFKKQFKRFTSLLFGDSESVSLQQRYFNASCLAAALAVFIGCITNILLKLNLYIIVLTAIVFIVLATIYTLSIKGYNYKKLLLIFTIIFYFFLTLLWITNSGSKGPTGYAFFILLIVINLIFGGRKSYLISFSLISLMIAVFFIEHYYPQVIFQYQNETQRFYDNLFTSTIFLILLSIILKYMINSYYNEKQNVERQRDLIVQQNKEMLTAEHELEIHKNHLEDLVKERTVELEKAVGELGIAKTQAENADKLKTAFLANVSHEIRTPMNSIIGFAELLSNDMSEEKRKQFVEIIQAKGKLLMRIINDVIDISKIESNQILIIKKNFSILNLLKEVYSTYKKTLEDSEGQVNLKLKISENIPNMIYSDEIRIKQIILNLIDNAIKYTKQGTIILGCDLKDEKLNIYVSDTGIGIQKDKQEIIFELFERINDNSKKVIEGTGLGLAISKKLAMLIDGNLTVESKYNVGSKFALIIPNISTTNKIKDEIITKVENEPVNRQWKGKTVLIAEDEIANYLLLEEYLSETKINVIKAKNGLEIIKELKKDQEINIILMDIRMPQMDGYQTIEIIKKEFPSIPVIAQTAYAFQSEIQKMKQVGFTDVILKPINQSTLINVLRKYL